MKKEYYLVKYEAAKDLFLTSWYEDGGNKWITFSGGWNPKSDKNTVLETQEAKDIHELDWKKTSIYRPDMRCGWLSREGTFYGCGSQDHDLIADLILNKSVGELEKEGWVRIWIDEEWTCQTRLSQQQYDYLSNNGYKLKESDQAIMG